MGKLRRVLVKLFFCWSIVMQFSIAVADEVTHQILIPIDKNTHYLWKNISFELVANTDKDNKTIDYALSLINIYAHISKTDITFNGVNSSRSENTNYLVAIAHRVDSEVAANEFLIDGFGDAAIDLQPISPNGGCYGDLKVLGNFLSRYVLIINGDLPSQEILNCLETAIPSSFGVRMKYQGTAAASDGRVPFATDALDIAMMYMNGIGLCTMVGERGNTDCVDSYVSARLAQIQDFILAN